MTPNGRCPYIPVRRGWPSQVIDLRISSAFLTTGAGRVAYARGSAYFCPSCVIHQIIFKRASTFALS